MANTESRLMLQAEQSEKYLFPIGLALVLFIAIIGPRLAAWGYFPEMDEGFMGFIGQYIWHSYANGNGFPADVSGYQLYPWLLSWLWALPGNGLIWMRLADLFAATLAGYLLCQLLVKESGSRREGLLLACAVLLGMNLPYVIDNGFKNSFFAAFACLFGALLLTREAPEKSFRWLYAGLLAALAVLLRETFCLFALLGAISLLIAKNFSALWRYCLGGILGFLALTIFCALCRGQGMEMFSMYFASGAVYAAEAARRWPNFLEYGRMALTSFWPLLLLAILAIITLGRNLFSGRALFWFIAASLPILEPLLKLGFLYHFSVCLPGLGGLCAFSFRQAPIGKKRHALMAACLASLFMLPGIVGHYKKLPVTVETLKSFPNADWPSKLAEQSNTIAAIAQIKRLVDKNATVSASSFAYFLLPGSGRLPPASEMADLSRAWIRNGEDAARFKEDIEKYQPKLVVIGEAKEDHSATFANKLTAIFDQLPNYSLEAIIPPKPGEKNYGWLGYKIYKREKDPAGHVAQEAS